MFRNMFNVGKVGTTPVATAHGGQGRLSVRVGGVGFNEVHLSAGIGWGGWLPSM